MSKQYDMVMIGVVFVILINKKVLISMENFIIKQVMLNLCRDDIYKILIICWVKGKGY